MRAWPRSSAFGAMQGSFGYWRPAATGGSTSASLARPYHLCERMAWRPVTFEFSPNMPCSKPACGVFGHSIPVCCLRAPDGLLPAIRSASLRWAGPRRVLDRATLGTPSGSHRPHGELRPTGARPTTSPMPTPAPGPWSAAFPCRRPATPAPRRHERAHWHWSHSPQAPEIRRSAAVPAIPRVNGLTTAGCRFVEVPWVAVPAVVASLVVSQKKVEKCSVPMAFGLKVRIVSRVPASRFPSMAG